MMVSERRKDSDVLTHYKSSGGQPLSLSVNRSLSLIWFALAISSFTSQFAHKNLPLRGSDLSLASQTQNEAGRSVDMYAIKDNSQL